MPTIGTGDDFAEYQTEAIDNGRMKHIPALVGFNSEEGLLYFSKFILLLLDTPFYFTYKIRHPR